MQLTANFKQSEFTDASTGGNVPFEFAANMHASAVLVQAVRDLVGLPVKITSFWRSPVREQQLGHTYKSQHMTASAVDCKVLVMDSVEAAKRIVAAKANGAFPDWGQLIVYPHTSKHLHISLPNRVSGRKNDVLCEVDQNEYAPWDGKGPLPAWRGSPRHGAPLVATAADAVTVGSQGAAPIAHVAPATNTEK